MLTIDNIIFVSRQEAAVILDVKVHTLDVWWSRKDHPKLHEGSFKHRGRMFYYNLLSLEDHFRKWDPKGYEHYTRISKPELEAMARASTVLTR